MTNEEVKQIISLHVPDALFEESQYLNVVIPSEKTHSLAKVLRENSSGEFDYLLCLSAVDWKDHFMIVYHLSCRKHQYTFVLKAKIPDRKNPEIHTVSHIWKTAEFHEREVYDLFGIKFTNHPDMRRFFLDDTWGFPLRKDYEDDVTIVSL